MLRSTYILNDSNNSNYKKNVTNVGQLQDWNKYSRALLVKRCCNRVTIILRFLFLEGERVLQRQAVDTYTQRGYTYTYIYFETK